MKSENPKEGSKERVRELCGFKIGWRQAGMVFIHQPESSCKCKCHLKWCKRMFVICIEGDGKGGGGYIGVGDKEEEYPVGLLH